MNANAMKLASGDDDWRPFDEVYEAFASANPMLGLNPSGYAATRLRQHYGPALLDAGAAVRLPNRRWLAHPRKFGPAVFAAMTARRDAILAGTARAQPDELGTIVPPGAR